MISWTLAACPDPAIANARSIAVNLWSMRVNALEENGLRLTARMLEAACAGPGRIVSASVDAIETLGNINYIMLML